MKRWLLVIALVLPMALAPSATAGWFRSSISTRPRCTRGRRAPLRLVGHDRTFRTRLREAYTAEINFGGRYILTVWGCGAECLMAAAIDTTTGRVAWTPFTLCCFGSITDQDVEPVIARPTSRLAVFTGLRNESGTLEPESTVFVFR